MRSFDRGPADPARDEGANLPKRPELHEGDSIDSLWEIHKRIQKPSLSILDVRDEKTGFLSRANLLLDEGVERINRAVPGSKLLVFIDVNHMGPPNKFGLRNEVDRFKRGIGDVIQRNLPKAKDRVIGYGGDEFVLILSDHVDEKALLRKIKGEIAELKKSLFSDRDPRVQEVENYAQLRSEVRKLRSKYVRMSGKNFSSGGFDYWLRSNLTEEQKDEASKLSGANLQLNVAKIKLSSRQAASRREVESGRGSGNEELLGLSIAVVRLGLDPDWEKYHRAIGQADFQIHENKREGIRSSLHPIGISDQIVTKHAAMDERAMLERTLLRQRTVSKMLENDSDMDMAGRMLTDQKMARLEHCDPALGDALRYESAQKEKLGRFLSVLGQREFVRTVIDVEDFGALNNNWGYVEADGFLRELNEMYRSEGEPSVVIRQGGKLIALGDRRLSHPKLNELEHDMNGILEPYLNDRVLTEHAEREALNDHEPVRKLRRSAKPSIHISVDQYIASADSLISEIAQGRPQQPPEEDRIGLFAIK